MDNKNDDTFQVTNVKMLKSVHTELRIIALRRGVTLQDLLAEAADRIIREHAGRQSQGGAGGDLPSDDGVTKLSAA